MKKIKDYVKQIDDELCGAKEYMEKALWYKAKGNNIRYTKYKEMAIQELSHADNIHTFAVEDITELQKVYPEVPKKMMDSWEKSHAEYVEREAWIKQMLTM
jgi:bacterioferritin (cytochrome b1)